MTDSYVFIGGPMDMQTYVTQGDYYFECMEQVEPLKATAYAKDLDPFGTSYTTHRYVLTKIAMMGVVRMFYISNNISTAEAEKRIGSFIASLIDLYANS